MPRATKNLHVPLPEPLYTELKTAAQRTGRPATEIARAAIDRWLAEERRAARRAEVAEYASRNAGTDVDLDADLERAALEHLRGEPPARKRRRSS